MKLVCMVLVGAALSLVAACGELGGEPVVHAFGGPTMGSTYEVKFVGAVAVADVRAAVAAELAAFDLAFSKWREDSEISRCNRAPAAQPFAASPLFCAVLSRALAIADLTDGAFDPTVGPLLAVYRRAKANPNHVLADADLDAARAFVDHHLVQVRDGAVVRAREGVQIDLDGLVAGACIDAIAARLDAMHVPAYYLQVTGEVFCRGEKAPGMPWQIGVVDPRADVTGGEDTVAILPLRDRSLCTSGDYRNGFQTAGHHVHHVFDPRTGRSTQNGFVSVSVLAKESIVADALGTAFLVLGDEGTRKVLAAMPGGGDIGVLMIAADGQGGLRPVEIGWPAAPPAAK